MIIMNTKLPHKQNIWTFWIAGIALLAGFILSILSWLELCVEHCTATHDYMLLGLPFAWIGIPFFFTLVTTHFLSRAYPLFTTIAGWMIASALGAEIVFILVQKYQIGHWCPVCLSIASCVFIAALAYSAGFVSNLFSQGETMNQLKKSYSTVSLFFIGLMIAFFGVSKPDAALAAANDMKEKIAFGKKGSNVEIYFITDWFCPSCRKIEPTMEKLLPKLLATSSFYFIDFPIHRKSLNFTPYNLAFLVHSKSQYLIARNLLTSIADKTDSPDDDVIVAAAKKEHIPFKELSFLDVNAGIDYYEKVANKYDLSATPTIIMTNTKTNKTKKLEGTDEISEESIMKAFETISK